MRFVKVIEWALEDLYRFCYHPVISVHIYGAGLFPIVSISNKQVFVSEQYSVRTVKLRLRVFSTCNNFRVRES